MALATKRFEPHPEDDRWRRACGCIKTSDKLKQLLTTFPSPPPPTPPNKPALKTLMNTCISDCCRVHCKLGHHMVSGDLNAATIIAGDLSVKDKLAEPQMKKVEVQSYTAQQVLACMVSLIQLSVTATALAIYYLIYLYMQLVYFTLKSALFFHNADGAMKVTIAVMTLTSVIIGINLIMKIEKVFGFGLNHVLLSSALTPVDKRGASVQPIAQRPIVVTGYQQ